jgi:hypothetical protein
LGIKFLGGVSAFHEDSLPLSSSGSFRATLISSPPTPPGCLQNPQQVAEFTSHKRPRMAMCLEREVDKDQMHLGMMPWVAEFGMGMMGRYS